MTMETENTKYGKSPKRFSCREYWLA